MDDTINLREFLSTLPVYLLRQIIAFAYYRKSVYVRGFSTMRKADLLEAICQRLDDPEIFKGVISWLNIRVSNNEYPIRPRS